MTRNRSGVGLAVALALSAGVPSSAAPQAPLPACPSTVVFPFAIPATCQLGMFSVEAFFDVYSPQVLVPQQWDIALYDDRIDLSFRYTLDQFSATAPAFPGDQYPFFEHRLYFMITPLTPAGYWQFGAGLTTSARANFTMPSPTSRAAMGAKLQVSSDAGGGAVGTGCGVTGIVGTAGCSLASVARTPLSITSLPYGYFYGFLSIESLFVNDGPGLMTAGYADVDLTASIYFTHDLTPVPEPATLGLLALGLLAAGTIERWRRRPPRRALNIGHKEATDCVGASGH